MLMPGSKPFTDRSQKLHMILDCIGVEHLGNDQRTANIAPRMTSPMDFSDTYTIPACSIPVVCSR
jgi:hypothetical protein